MTVGSRLALVGDIGGTHARFAVSDIDELTVTHFVSFRCASFASLEAAVAAYLDSVPYRPAMASLAVAGPVDGDRIRFTNLSWSPTRSALKAATGAEHLHLVNDFAALALVLPHLGPHDLHPIGAAAVARDGPRIVVGPGTGLGMAALVPSAGDWVPVASEGGHVAFAPQNDLELRIADRLRGDDGHASAERALSGPGLVAVYRILGDIRGQRATATTPSEIVRLGLHGEDPLAVEAVGLFVAWLGRFAGDAALSFGARAGVYLAGGIPPHLIPALEKPAFRAAFEAKGRLSSYLAQIPIAVIKAADAGLRGAALSLSIALPAA